MPQSANLIEAGNAEAFQIVAHVVSGILIAQHALVVQLANGNGSALCGKTPEHALQLRRGNLLVR